MRTAAQAVAYARRYSRYQTQMCLNAVQTWLGAPWSGPYAMWAWQQARHRHPGDKHPPPGVPVWWSSAASRYGHIALSVGGGRVRSTDYPSRGQVGEATIDQITRWGTRYTYQGWAEDLGGQRIPGIGSTPAPAPSQEDITMRIIEAAGKGSGLYGPGYFKTLTKEERDVLVGQGVPYRQGNAREFDVIRAAMLQGKDAGK